MSVVQLEWVQFQSGEGSNWWRRALGCSRVNYYCTKLIRGELAPYDLGIEPPIERV